MSWYKGTPTGPSTKTLWHATPHFSFSFFHLPTHLPYLCIVLSLITPTSFIYSLSRTFFLSLWQQAKIRGPAKFPCPTFPCTTLALLLLPAWLSCLSFNLCEGQDWLACCIFICILLHTDHCEWKAVDLFLHLFHTFQRWGEDKRRWRCDDDASGGRDAGTREEGGGGLRGSSFQGTPPELMFHTCAQCCGLYQASQVRHINCGRDHFSCHRGVPLGSREV